MRFWAIRADSARFSGSHDTCHPLSYFPFRVGLFRFSLHTSLKVSSRTRSDFTKIKSNCPGHRRGPGPVGNVGRCANGLRAATERGSAGARGPYLGPGGITADPVIQDQYQLLKLCPTFGLDRILPIPKQVLGHPGHAGCGCGERLGNLQGCARRTAM